MKSDIEIEEARALIVNGEAECVIIKDEKIVMKERGRGVSPLLFIYENNRSAMKGSIVIDKVIGRAAAAIAISGGARHVHGEVMSEDAVNFLKDNGITSSQTHLVPLILNRKRDGRCPLELSVDGIKDPASAITAMKKRVQEIRKAFE